MQMSGLQSLRIHVPLVTHNGPGCMDWKLLARHPALQSLDVSLFLQSNQPVPTDLLSLPQLTTLRITSPHPEVILKLASMTSIMLVMLAGSASSIKSLWDMHDSSAHLSKDQDRHENAPL